MREMHQVVRSWSLFSRLGPRVRSVISRTRKGLHFDREFINALRFEIEMAYLRCHNAVSPAHRRKVRAIRSRTGIKLNIGCGNDALDGWINLDSFAPSIKPEKVLLLDLRAPLPVADTSVAFVYSEHFLEHLNRAEHGRPLLRELHRALQPGGAVRIVVPDGKKMLEAYFDSNHPVRRLYPDRPWMDVIHWMARGDGGHKYLYDAEVLIGDLRDAGFAKAYECQAGEGRFPEVLMDNPDAERRAFRCTSRR